jgi:hypothetical protein
LSTPKTLGQYTGNFKCSTIYGDYTIHLDGQTIVFAMVMPALASSPKGTLFYLASIDLLSKHEQQVIDEARQQGWNVVVSTVDISFSSPQKLQADSGGVLRLANRIDSHLAARAYAVESMMAFLAETRPDFMELPRVLVGMSAGAIAAPTVAARVGNFDAAVLIGGGENVAGVMLTSPLFAQHTTLHEPVIESDDNGTKGGDEQVTDATRRMAFASEVLSASRLDPAKTSAALGRLPVLMVHARYDKIVRASAGDELRKSLGSPERWIYNTGHVGLCVMMKWKFRPILLWAERQTAPKSSVSQQKKTLPP